MVATRQDIRMVEEFEELDFSAYTTNQSNTDGSIMGRTPGVNPYTWGLNTQRHIDVRTFSAQGFPTSVNENWTVQVGGTMTVGPQTTLNGRLGLKLSLGANDFKYVSSTTGAMDLTRLNNPNAHLVLALPNLPLSNLIPAVSTLVLSDGTTSQTLFMSNSTTALANGNCTATFPLSAITNVNLAHITNVQISWASTGSCNVYMQGLRVVDPNWVSKDVDVDNLNGCLRACVPLDGNINPTPGNQALPLLWYAAPVPGIDDPRPINTTFAVVFYTGSQTGIDSFTLNLRDVNGVDATQLALDNATQIQLSNGNAQPGLVTSTLLGRSLNDLQGVPVASIDTSVMNNMDAVAATINQSWISFTMGWGLGTGITISRSWVSSPDYQWIGTQYVMTNGSTTFANNTYYLALISLTDTVAQMQVYSLNQTNFAVGTLLFDTGQIPDSYRFIRRGGRVGWKAVFQDGDSFVRSVRPESMVFAEYQSAPLNSNTPVQGVHVFTHFAPRVQLWQNWTAVAGGGVTPGVKPDSQRSTSGQSTRIDITQISAGQGVISNTLSPLDDTISGITNWSATEIDFDLWFPSAALNAGGGISLYLLSQDGYMVPLSMPRIIPDQWQSVTCFAPAGLQSGRYQFGITYTGNVAATFWVDSVDIVERTVLWGARANATDPWVDFRDEISSNSAGVLFTSRGSQLQVRAQALRQDGTVIGAPKIVPVYAQLGRPVWPENKVPDPVTLNAATPFTVSASPTHGSPVTFTNGVTSTPAGMIIDWLWSFGDGSSANGLVVQHTYTFAGTYTVVLTIVDAWGNTTPYTSTVAVA